MSVLRARLGRLHAEAIDALQHLPLSEEATHPSCRATYLPAFSHNVVLQLTVPPEGSAVLSMRTILRVCSHLPPPRSTPPGRSRRRREAPPEPLDLGLRWAGQRLAPVHPEPPLLSEEAPVPAEAIAAWRRSIGRDPIGMVDDEERVGRDGMVMFAEVFRPPHSTVFSAWGPEAGGPWDAYFQGLHAIAAAHLPDPTAQRCLDTIARYFH